MFNIGAGEMILIALVLLIAVGPEQLPGLLRRAGRTMGQLRSMSEGLRSDFMSSMDELERASDPRKWGVDDDPTSSSRPVAEKPKSKAGETASDDSVQSEPFSFSAPIMVPPPFASSADLEAMRKPSGDDAAEPEVAEEPEVDDEGPATEAEPDTSDGPLTTDSAYDGLGDELDHPGPGDESGSVPASRGDAADQQPSDDDGDELAS